MAGASMPEERKHPACIECRRKKLRCVPSGERCGGCRRCVRLGEQCKVLEGKRRKRKARSRQRHVDLLQSSYAEILILLNQRVQVTSPPGTSTSQSLSTTSREAPPHLGPRDPGSLIASPPFFPATVAADISHHEELQHLINYFHLMSKQPNFAFVVLPESCHALRLIKERPMLAQAILIVASWNTPARQRALRTNYLKELGNRYFARSERSLDLLQSLVVYFGWCHWYSPSFTFRAYRLATIIVTLTIELGISERPLNARQRQIYVDAEPRLVPRDEATSSKFWSYEARRTFIAAYVCSNFCWRATRRPALLPFTQYLQDFAASLAADPQYSSDVSLIHQVGSMRFAEQTSSPLYHGPEESIGQVSDDKLQMLVKDLARELDEWRALLPSGATRSGCPLWSYQIARAFIHEVSLHGVSPDEPISVIRAEIIYECHIASMKVLTDISESSLSQMALWSVLDWGQLNFVVMCCTKSSIILDSTQCSPKSSQRAVWLSKCLKALCIRARDLHGLAMAVAPQDLGQDHFLTRLAAEWTKFETFYRKCVQRNTMCVSETTDDPIACLKSSDFPSTIDYFNQIY